MRQDFANAMDKVHSVLPRLVDRVVDRRAVFANNELDMGSIRAYGFDYDYTLAVYTFELNRLIYELAIKRLVEENQYPPELLTMPYDPRWAIRGLHIDRNTATMMKLDAFCRIQPGTVYRGYKQLDKSAVLELFKRFAVPEEYLDLEMKSRTPHNFVQLADLFSLPQAGLVANVTEFCQTDDMPFDPVLLFHDVDSAVGAVHISGDLYRRVTADRLRFLHANPGLHDLLQHLRKSAKTLFLLTNSPYSFMLVRNECLSTTFCPCSAPGMEFMLGSEWRSLFDYVIVQARKPHFFADRNRPFRELDIGNNVRLYSRVERLEKGKVYTGGNIGSFMHMCKLSGKRQPGVLYFGDHISTDLAHPMAEHGWHTGAVVPELEREIRIQNSAEFKLPLLRVTMLRELIEKHQRQAVANGRGALAELEDWMAQYRRDRDMMKTQFNPQFGSMFRTYHNPSYFSRRLMRLSDIYMSRLPNLLSVGGRHVFHPRRAPLAHELFVTEFY